MPDLDEVQKQIKNKRSLGKFLSRREVKELPSILWEDESVESIIQGTYNNGNGILVATNKRLIFVDKGFVKLKVEDFPYDKISTIQYETGMLLGKMSVFTSGNRAEIKNLVKQETKPFAEYVRARITSKAAHASFPVNQSASSSGDSDNTQNKIQQLEKLAELKQKGILNEKEFAAEKKKLLG